MSLLTPVYRATVYAPKSQDPTETTALTPVAGAAHSDAFKIATAEGVSGYKSYMDAPSGRRGRMDVLSKKTDTGELSFSVLDQRTTVGGSNALRWVTAFVGDAKGLPRFRRLKCFVEESLYGLIRGTGGNGTYTAVDATTWTTSSEVGRRVDVYDGAATPLLPYGALILSTTVTANTTTTLTFTGNATGATTAQVWAPFFTGRIRAFGQRDGSRTMFGVSVRDTAEDLTWSIFTGRPHGNVYQTTARLTAGAQTSTTLKDTTQAWAINQWAGASVTLTKGTGVGQRRVVLSNTSDTLTVAVWAVTPDATTTYSFGYAQLVSVMPVGFVYPYGGVDAGGNPLVAVTKKLDAKIGTIDATNGWAQLNLDAVTGLTWIETLLNSSLFAGVAPTKVWQVATSSAPDVSKTIPPQFTGVAVARIIRKDTGAEGDFQIGFITHQQITALGTTGFQMQKASIVGMGIRPVSYPLGVATGAPQANGAQAAAPTAATSSVTTKGWTISITGIVQGGDILSFSSHAQRYLVVANANSDGSGNSTLTLKPGLQAAIANSEVITVQSSPARLALPPATTAVQFSVTCDMRLQDGGQKNKKGTYQPGNLLLISDVHPVQHIKDVLQGWFGRIYQPSYNTHSQPSVALPPGKNLGDPWIAIPVMNTDPFGDGRHGFNALVADGTFPSYRNIIDTSLPIRDYIESLCRQYGIGYYFDGAGNFVPVDMRQPGAVIPGIITITNADLRDDIPPNWTYDSSLALTSGAYTVYAEGIIQPIAAKLQIGESLPAITTKMFDVASNTISDLSLGDPDLVQKEYTVDARGYRAMPNEVGFRWQNGTNVVPQSRWDLIQQAIVDMVHKTVKRPYGNGVQTVTLTAVRNANTTALMPGSFFILSIVEGIDPATNTRGPARLMMLTEKTENGPTVRLVAIDWGVNVIANAPTLSNPVNLTGDTSHSQTSIVTLNAQNEAAEVWVNVTSTAVGTRPLDSDPNWTFVSFVYVSGWTAIVRNMPTGSRIYWRVRANPHRDPSTPGQDLGTSALKTPSVWAYPAVDHADLTTMTGPSGLASSLITPNTFTVTWAPNDATRIVEVWLATPTTDARARIAVLTPGATRFDFSGLGALKTYRVGIREIDGSGGGAETTIDVTTTAGASVVNPPINTRGKRLFV